MRLLAASLATGLCLASASAQSAVDPGSTGPAWNPYLVGALIGLLCLFTLFFSDKPLGASTAYARMAGLIGKCFAPARVRSLSLYREKAPLIDWQLMLVLAVIAGSFLAAWTGGELTGRWLPPLWIDRFGGAVWLRLAVGFLGGAVMAYGARMAGGCTSGHGISGTLQLSVGSWISLICFFIGGAITASMMFRL